MKTHFDILLAARERLVKTVEGLSLAQVLYQPPGFSNHIAWNFCHILVSQQILTYGKSQKPFVLEQSIIDTFRRGTKAEDNISTEFWIAMQEMAIATAERLQTDYQSGLFDTFEPYTTGFGYHLADIEGAVAFNNVHEGLHIGYIMAQKKLLPS